MSVQALSWVFDTVPGNAMTHADRLVLLSLANHAGRESWECWPSHATIAREAGVSPATVKRALRNLTDSGLITIVYQSAPDARVPGRYRTNLYTLNKDYPQGAQPEPPQISTGGSTTTPQGAQPRTVRGLNDARSGGSLCTPKPSIEPSEEPRRLEIVAVDDNRQPLNRTESKTGASALRADLRNSGNETA